jgi:hypothetical protein
MVGSLSTGIDYRSEACPSILELDPIEKAFEHILSYPPEDPDGILALDPA